MSRISGIILRVRDTLADPSGDRWSDDRLIRLIDEAQKDICKVTKALRYSVDIEVHQGQSNYTLPKDSQALSRILYNKKVLKLVSVEQMDNISSIWEDSKGDPLYAITNKMDRGIVRLSPTPDSIEPDTLGIYYIKTPDQLVDVSSDLELEELYDKAIKLYVTGSALRDDADTLNRQMGNEELQLYYQEIQQIAKEVSKDFVQNDTVYETKYRSAF